MKSGVYSKSNFEIAVSKEFVLIHYKKIDYYGVKLFRNNKIIAFIERKTGDRQIAKYFFHVKNNIYCTNFDILENIVDEVCDIKQYENDNELSLKDKIIVNEDKPYLPTVSESGIEKCLKLWTMGIEFNVTNDSFYFHMQTNKLEYIVSIQHNESKNIYCGISINMPFENGLFGSGQYFRIRNLNDNSEPYCWWICNLGQKVEEKDFTKLICESGKCIQNNEGTYWLIKRYTDDQIVLQGCGEDEYIYNRILNKVEYFIVT